MMSLHLLRQTRFLSLQFRHLIACICASGSQHTCTALPKHPSLMTEDQAGLHHRL